MLIRLALAVQDKALPSYLEERFASSGVQVEQYGHLRTSWQKVVRSSADIIVISDTLLPHPAISGISMLNDLPENPTTVILHSKDSSDEHAELVAAGADVVLYSGVSRQRLAEAIETTLESRRQFIQKNRFDRLGRVKPKLGDFISDSQSMQIFMEEVKQVVASDSLLLILGETGVGKEHLARAIHAESPRSAGPFITVNTAALPEQLLESELFGHTQGAFTGAIRSRRGAFELAHGGTIFLDEVGEMPLYLQTKLLRVLQDYEISPVGSEKPIWVDVRVVAATNRDLEREVDRGLFRKDLFYRLSVITLTVPPLRQRKEDIPALARRFVDVYRYKLGRETAGLSNSSLKALAAYEWPGNVRELMNVIERGILLCKSDKISLRDLPHVFHGEAEHPEEDFLSETPTMTGWKHKTLPEVQQEVWDRVERLYLEMVLKDAAGRVGKAARIAGIHPRSLYNKMRRLGLRKEDFKAF